jgi:hypothetical protein
MMVRKKSGIIFALMACILLFAGSVWAADPGYSKSSMGPKLTNGITEEFVAMVREDEAIQKGKPLRLGSGIKDGDLAKLASLADVLTGLEIESTDLTDLSPISSLTASHISSWIGSRK